MSEDNRFPCVCCGYLVFEDPVGSWMICPICWWEDDLTQARWPMLTGAANQFSLIECQQNYLTTRASTVRLSRFVRAPLKNELKDPGFRLIDLSVDNFEQAHDHDHPWPDDRTALYWWRPTYWRAGPRD